MVKNQTHKVLGILIGVPFLITCIQSPISSLILMGQILVGLVKFKSVKAKQVEEKKLEQFRIRVDRHSMSCHNCRNLVRPDYIGFGTGPRKYDELWKYICNNCDRSWKEYWPYGS